MPTDSMFFSYYPGVEPVTNALFAHPQLVDMAELSIEPFAQPADVDGQGTIYHFPVSGDVAGNDPKLHSETHWHRACRTWAWKEVAISGTVKIATEAGRASNATAYTHDIPFSFVLTESDIPDKHMVDSLTIAGGTYPKASIAHVGTIAGGELVTNADKAGALGSLGYWRFAELTNTPTLKYTTLVTTVTAYDSTGVDSDISVEIVCNIFVSAFGNSSVLRYNDETDNWQWVSIFLLYMSAELAYDSELPSGFFVVGPDGSRDPDNIPLLNTVAVACSTSLDAISEDTSTTTDVGSCVFDSTESLSPDPLIYENKDTMSIDVPWYYDGTGTPTTVQRGVWTSVLVEFNEPLLSVVPPQNP